MNDTRANSAPPVVAIVGRPNVGKSALFNSLLRERIAIVDPKAGVTRDRVSALAEHDGRTFELWDTGGMGSPDDLAEEVELQIDLAMRRADLILFVVDVQAGLVAADELVAEKLRSLRDRVLLVANKADHPKHELQASEFYSLGFGEALCVSALHGYGCTELAERILEATPEVAVRPPSPELRLAIVGRQNVGKSTLINALAQEERVIVNEQPGTTRDSIDVVFELGGQRLVAIDTAGLKRRTRIKDSVEFYSFTRTDAALRRADVALFLIDATSDITRMDMRIAHRIEELGKPCAIVVNKWDLAEGAATEAYLEYLNDRMPTLSYAPVSFISAKEGLRVRDAVGLALELREQANARVTTATLNELLRLAQERKRPERSHNAQPKIFYGTQLPGSPPTFLLFASHPHLISEQYTRYLTAFLREALGDIETPIRVFYRSRRSDEDERTHEEKAPRQGRKPTRKGAAPQATKAPRSGRGRRSAPRRRGSSR